MAGYTRQSEASIQPGEDITAAPLNAEFDAVEDAFNGTTGHTHDGTTGNGPKIPFASLLDTIDEDNMSSNSATKIPTQQSVKAYVDTGLATKANTTDLNDKADVVHTHTKDQVGLTNVDNTSDANKPISTATQTALDGKQATLQAGHVFTGLVEKKVAMAANDIDLLTGNFFTKTISGATTFTISNWPTSGNAGSFILELTNGGSATITLPTGSKLPGGTPLALTAAGKDILGAYSHDGGITINWVVLAKDVK